MQDILQATTSHQDTICLQICGASSVSNLFKFWRYQDPITYYEVIRFLDVLVSKIANKGGWVIQHLLGILHFV